MLRIIPRLDIKGANLVKGIHLEGLKVLGPPALFAEAYYRDGADELLLMDAVASLYGRNSLTDIITWTARNIFIPFTVGGGLRSLQDIRGVLEAGADKAALNTAAVNRPQIIREASEEFGSSTIVVSIEAQKLDDGRYYAYIDNGRENTRRDVFEWAQEAVHLGAGELLVTSVHREGTGAGYDCELTARLAQSVGVPVVASGGAGTIDHVVAVATAGAADAICVASVLHYDKIAELVRRGMTFGQHGEFPILAERRENFRITPASLSGIKAALAVAGVECRQSSGADIG